MARGDTHPIEIVLEVLNQDSVLQQMVPEGFHFKIFPDGNYKLYGRVCLSMVQPTETPTFHLGVIEVLLGMKYEGLEDDHLAKVKAAQRIVSLLDTNAYVAADGSSTGQIVFQGWSEIDAARQDLPQDMTSLSFQFGYPIHPVS